MVKDELRPDVGKSIFIQHQAELEQGLQQLAGALGYDQELTPPAEFFQAFISGFWDPFQDACDAGNQQQEGITTKIRSLEKQLRQGMTPDAQDMFGQYSGLRQLRFRSFDACKIDCKGFFLVPCFPPFAPITR